MRKVSDYERECGRCYRPRRNADRRGLPFPHKWGGNFAAMTARACVMIALDCAAEHRRLGTTTGKRFAKFSLENARCDFERWRVAGGYLPG